MTSSQNNTYNKNWKFIFTKSWFPDFVNLHSTARFETLYSDCLPTVQIFSNSFWVSTSLNRISGTGTVSAVHYITVSKNLDKLSAFSNLDLFQKFNRRQFSWKFQLQTFVIFTFPSMMSLTTMHSFSSPKSERICSSSSLSTPAPAASVRESKQMRSLRSAQKHRWRMPTVAGGKRPILRVSISWCACEGVFRKRLFQHF